MKLVIRAGVKSPCELVDETGRVWAEGTHTHCTRVRNELKGQQK